MSLVKSYYNNHEEADDSSTVFDADTVVSVTDEVPSLTPSTLTATATFTEAGSYHYHHQQFNNSSNNNIDSSHPHSSQEGSHFPPASISELLRRVNSLPVPSTITTASATTTPITAESESYTSSSSHHSSSRTQQPGQSYSSVLTLINQLSSSQTSITATTTNQHQRNEAKWMSRFQELCAYKQVHGHTSVPQRSQEIYRDLGVWVSKQRYEYTKLKAKKHSQLTSARIEMLNSIGFEWVCKNKSMWNERFIELLAYKEKYGNTNVPQKKKDLSYKQLGGWVSKQRQYYKMLKANKKTFLSPERVELLNSIGFQWSCLMPHVVLPE